MELLDTLSNLSENLQSEEHAVLCENILLSFINNNENSFSFTDYPSEVYEKIIGHLFTFISTRHRIMQVSLKVIRLLSRDKVIVTALSNAESYVKIFNEIISSPDAEESWKIEALKCSCNWVYHSNIIRNFLITCNISKNLIEDTSKCNQLLSVRTFYNVRILFLMSALEPSERLVMLENNAINVLTTVGNQVFNQVNQEGEKSSLDEAHQNILVEIFKALFNITCQFTSSVSEKIINDCSELVLLLRNLLIKFSPFLYDDSIDLLSHAAHLLVNMPQKSLHLLYFPATNEIASEKVFCGYNMDAIFILLRALDARIQLKNYRAMCDKSMAVFTAFCYICRINPFIRKYLKKQVLPVLKVSDKRPEENNDLRGRIVKLMTTIDVTLKNMAADFLFVLCKENNVRLIRYAGYGNSAGYLSSRGLMIPGMIKTEGEYSDDELSDIDDDELDIMTGATRCEPEDSFDKLTEEEKEAETDKLVNLLGRLQDMNLIKPMSVNKDGKMTEIKPENFH